MSARLQPVFVVAILAALMAFAGCGGSGARSDSPFQATSLTTRIFQGFNIGEPVPSQIGTGTAAVQAGGQFSGTHTITATGETQTLTGQFENDGRFAGTLSTESGTQTVNGQGALYTDSSGFRLDVRNQAGTPLITLDLRYD